MVSESFRIIKKSPTGLWLLAYNLLVTTMV